MPDKKPSLLKRIGRNISKKTKIYSGWGDIKKISTALIFAPYEFTGFVLKSITKKPTINYRPHTAVSQKTINSAKKHFLASALLPLFLSMYLLFRLILAISHKSDNLTIFTISFAFIAMNLVSFQMYRCYIAVLNQKTGINKHQKKLDDSLKNQIAELES
jgi:hypothetical protein